MSMFRGQLPEGRTRRVLLIALVIAGVVFPLTIICYNVGIFNYVQNTDLESEETDLRTVLERAAMENKTVVLTSLNEAWSAPGSLIDLFFESFQTGLHTSRYLEHLVIIALDDKAYEKCRSTHPHCYPLKTEGVDFSGEKRFMTEDYLKMVWRKVEFLYSVLELGYSFIFSDADVMWFRDPMPLFLPDGDIHFSCDHYNGIQDYMANTVNTGFHYVKANEKTKMFFKFWNQSRENMSRLHDQDALNTIKNHQNVRDIGVNVYLVPTVYFAGICEPSRDFDMVHTMHSNCCIGLENKINDLKLVLNDWKKYRALPPAVKSMKQSNWSIPQRC